MDRWFFLGVFGPVCAICAVVLSWFLPPGSLCVFAPAPAVVVSAPAPAPAVVVTVPARLPDPVPSGLTADVLWPSRSRFSPESIRSGAEFWRRCGVEKTWPPARP
jgi:hypothetical protein